jgi:hypothetical protein
MQGKGQKGPGEFKKGRRRLFAGAGHDSNVLFFVATIPVYMS